MTTNKPNVKRYDNMRCPEEICRVDTMYESDDGDYVEWEAYEALQAECEKLRKTIRSLCNTYIVDDYYGGDLREERLNRAVERAIDAAMTDTAGGEA